jgi:hypothetical protein
LLSAFALTINAGVPAIHHLPGKALPSRGANRNVMMPN